MSTLIYYEIFVKYHDIGQTLVISVNFVPSYSICKVVFSECGFIEPQSSFETKLNNYRLK